MMNGPLRPSDAGVLEPLPARPPNLEPIGRPIMIQRWTDVVFLHWSYEPAVVQRLLPAGVTVDQLDGRAWVGLVPFRMERLGFPGLAPLPFVGTFPEVNVRTYVRAGVGGRCGSSRSTSTGCSRCSWPVAPTT